MYCNLEELKEKINTLAGNGKPFLFGINYELDEGFLIEDPMNQKDVLFKFNGVGNKKKQLTLEKTPEIEIFPIDFQQYSQKFEIIQREIAADRISVINLTARTHIQTTITPQEIFESCTSLYQLYIPDRFVCFSPEIFIQIEDRNISTYPMKGTIDATLPGAEDQLLNNSKEIDEHRKTVQTICDDLSLVAQEVKVKRFRYLDHLHTTTGSLLQTSSEVVGILEQDYLSHLGDIIIKLLPGTSIVGSPKDHARQVIEVAEAQTRGYYCGIAGYFDGQKLDTCVLIRFIEIDGQNLYFRSGGGVTAQSNCQGEYQELIKKIYLTR